MEILFCKCGKLCKTENGLKQHQKVCGVALAASVSGDTIKKRSESVSYMFCNDVQKFWDLAELIANDADDALKGNKSASRRSRANLIELRNMIPSFRKLILDRNK